MEGFRKRSRATGTAGENINAKFFSQSNVAGGTGEPGKFILGFEIDRVRTTGVSLQFQDLDSESGQYVSNGEFHRRIPCRNQASGEEGEASRLRRLGSRKRPPGSRDQPLVYRTRRLEQVPD